VTGVDACAAFLRPLWRSYGLCGLYLFVISLTVTLCAAYQGAGAPSVGVFAVALDRPFTAAPTLSWLLRVRLYSAPSGDDLVGLGFGNVCCDRFARAAAPDTSLDILAAVRGLRYQVAACSPFADVLIQPIGNLFREGDVQFVPLVIAKVEVFAVMT
jgi:hypothetical protein